MCHKGVSISLNLNTLLIPEDACNWYHCRYLKLASEETIEMARLKDLFHHFKAI